MALSNISYYWVKFYPQAPWQVVKFYNRGKTKYLKALDWGFEHELDKFDNKNYEVGHKIIPPEDSTES